MSTPYIGSKISLISRLDIRYEGTLFQVDPVESTISLSQVRSFGTEDRPAPVSVPARSEVYEFIIFKASDIKDLIVCETPKEPGVDDITYDPAIVSVSKPPAEASAKQPAAAVDQQRATDEKTSQRSSPQQQQQKKQPPLAPPPYIPPPNVPSAFQPPTQPQQRAAVAGDRLDLTKFCGVERVGSAQQSEPNLGGFGQRAQRSFFNRAQQPQTPGPLSNAHLNQQPQQQQNRRPYYPLRQPVQHQQQQEYHQQPYHHQQAGQIRRGYQPPANRQPYQHFRAQFQREQPRFDGDFDFEKANQQFQTIGDIGDKLAEIGLNEVEKLSSIHASGGGSARGSEERSISAGSEVGSNNNNNSSANKSLVPDNFYDKTQSFFDNISCDALEREEGRNNRMDWKKERITNQETFGQTAVRSMMHFQRGGGRGGGGAPFLYRGGYNNHHHNNNYHHQQQHPQYYQQRNQQQHRFGMQRQFQPPHHHQQVQQQQQQ
uniref:Uncharacterized protein n=1 Tax=Globodera rostochiensis TaxID=31243 RepID=A0A914GST8_GLORO